MSDVRKEQMNYKIYNEEGTLVAVNLEQILELLQLNNYTVIKENKDKKGESNGVN